MFQRARHSPLHICSLSDSYSAATQVEDRFHEVITNTVRQQLSRVQELDLGMDVVPPSRLGPGSFLTLTHFCGTNA